MKGVFQISNLRSLAESVSRQLSAWARSLQESDIEGPRRLTDARKADHDQRKRAEAFMARLREEYGEKIEANIRKQANTEAAG